MTENKRLRFKIKDLIVGSIIYKIYRETKTFFVVQINGLVKKQALNIGGGPNFRAIGWLNFEEQKSSVNVNPVKLNAHTRFPLKDASMRLIYTSHCFEHLDNETVGNVLKESLRVLRDDGDIVVKIPDFDLILNAWKTSNASLFAYELWDYDSIVYTWKNRNIEDCLDYRAAALFCGFWNDAYGNHFGKKIFKNKNAYHGPAVVDIKTLRALIDQRTPWQISNELSRIVESREKGYHFNHRNAWSRDEFGRLVASAGFKMVTFDREIILRKFKMIPGIKAMQEKSMYCWIKKT